MEIEKDKIQETVVQCLLEIVPEYAEKVNSETNPIINLGIDSQDGILLALMLEEKLELKIPEESNPLVDDINHKPRIVGEIVNALINLLKKKQEKNNG